jgi:hypothetical protein
MRASPGDRESNPSAPRDHGDGCFIPAETVLRRISTGGERALEPVQSVHNLPASWRRGTAAPGNRECRDTHGRAGWSDVQHRFLNRQVSRLGALRILLAQTPARCQQDWFHNSSDTLPETARHSSPHRAARCFRRNFLSQSRLAHTTKELLDLEIPYLTDYRPIPGHPFLRSGSAPT